MNILIVSTSFYPELSPRSFRTTELVKELCRMGHNVTLITGDKSPERAGLAEEFNFEIISIGPLTFRFFRSGTMSGLNKVLKVLNKGMQLFLEYPDIEIMYRVREKLKFIEKPYDLLISIAVPHPTHWGVAWAKSKDNPIAPVWIADCGDPYMGCTTDRFRKPFYFKYFEKWFCKKADFITIPKIDMKDNFYPEFHDKFREIPQGFNFEESRAYLLPYKPNPIPTFAFSGSFIPNNRDPRPLLDFLVASNRPFKFHIFTRTRKLIEPYLSEAKEKN